MENTFYIAMLGRENIFHNYREAKKAILEEVKKYKGVLWETSYEIRQLWLNDILTDAQYEKLCELSFQ